MSISYADGEGMCIREKAGLADNYNLLAFCLILVGFAVGKNFVDKVFRLQCGLDPEKDFDENLIQLVYDDQKYPRTLTICFLLHACYFLR